MIKINLATRKQSGAVGERKNSGLGGALGKLNLEQFKALPIRKVAIPLLVGCVASYMLDSYKEDELKRADDLLARLNSEGNKKHAELGKFKEYEGIKKDLDEDELTIKTKLDTIRKLLLDRTTPPKLVVSVAEAIPKNVWLQELKLQKSEVTFKGGSLGFTEISDFMKNLNQNAYFTDVELKNTQQNKDTGSEIATFELSAKRR